MFGKEWLSRRSWLRLKEAAPLVISESWLRLIALALAVGTWIAVRRSLHF